jgi:hypothetical protein
METLASFSRITSSHRKRLYTEFMDHLPDELLLHTMSFLSTRDHISIHAASIRYQHNLTSVSQHGHHARILVCASDYCIYRRYVHDCIDPCVQFRHDRSFQSGLYCVTNMVYRIMWFPLIVVPLLVVLVIDDTYTSVWYNYLDDILDAILYTHHDLCLCRYERPVCKQLTSRSHLRTSCLYNLAIYISILCVVLSVIISSY